MPLWSLIKGLQRDQSGPGDRKRRADERQMETGCIYTSYQSVCLNVDEQDRVHYCFVTSVTFLHRLWKAASEIKHGNTADLNWCGHVRWCTASKHHHPPCCSRRSRRLHRVCADTTVSFFHWLSDDSLMFYQPLRAAVWWDEIVGRCWAGLFGGVLTLPPSSVPAEKKWAGMTSPSQVI